MSLELKNGEILFIGIKVCIPKLELGNEENEENSVLHNWVYIDESINSKSL